jgi:hypothetical protein
MVDIEPMYADQMITTSVFVPLARRAAIPGVVLEMVKFGAFRVQYEAHSFIVYIAQVAQNSC